MTRILIAEDEERIASFICKGLSAAGFTTTVVADGASAYEYARGSQFDLMILDLGLPVPARRSSTSMFATCAPSSGRTDRDRPRHGLPPHSGFMNAFSSHAHDELTTVAQVGPY